VDVEPCAPLPAHLLTEVATNSERRQLNGDLIAARQLFCMKEAVYKATNPLDGGFLDHHDIEVCMKSGIATTSSGHTLRIHTADSPRLLAVTVMSETCVV
jgi:4'-phosphopantetheinyl transferase EntD